MGVEPTAPVLIGDLQPGDLVFRGLAGGAPQQPGHRRVGRHDPDVPVVHLGDGQRHRDSVVEAPQDRLALAQRQFRLLPLGDVGGDPADGEGGPVGAEHGDLDNERRAGAIGVRDDLLEFGWGERLERLPVVRPEEVGDTGLEEVAVGLADDPLLTHVELLGERAVDQQVASFEVLEEDRRLDVVQDGPQSCLAPGEGLLHELPLGDVLVGDEGPAGPVPEARHAADEPAPTARAVAGVLAGELGAAAGEHLADTRGEGRRALGALALRLVAGVEVVGTLGDAGVGGRVRRGETAPGPVDREDGPGLVDDGDARRERVEHVDGVQHQHRLPAFPGGAVRGPRVSAGRHHFSNRMNTRPSWTEMSAPMSTGWVRTASR